MKNLNKKLYTVIIACLLMLCFSVVSMATDGTDSIVENTSSDVSAESSKEETTNTSSEIENVTSETSSAPSSESSAEQVSSDKEEGASSEEKTETSSSETEDSNETQNSTSSSLVIDTSSKSTTSVQSQKDASSSNKVSGNVGGIVVDEPDTSGWGGSDSADGEDSKTSSNQSEIFTQKKTEKNITNFSGLFWILIWIPILLIIASVCALIYVNRKAFLTEENFRFDKIFASSSNKKKISQEEKAKRKNNRKNRTNVYRPRD